MTPPVHPRWPTAAERMAHAYRFDLPYSPTMQDWEWEVADPARFGEFLAAYTTGDLSDGERVSLAEILVQCVEDMRAPTVGASPEWASVAALLLARPDLHASTVDYWSSLEAVTPVEGFWVTAPMRRLRAAMR